MSMIIFQNCHCDFAFMSPKTKNMHTRSRRCQNILISLQQILMRFSINRKISTVIWCQGMCAEMWTLNHFNVLWNVYHRRSNLVMELLHGIQFQSNRSQLILLIHLCCFFEDYLAFYSCVILLSSHDTLEEIRKVLRKLLRGVISLTKVYDAIYQVGNK